jgi:hypothetical protein
MNTSKPICPIRSTWIYSSTYGSLLLVGLLHAMSNLVTASPAGGTVTTTVLNATPMIGAILVVAIFKPANLFRAEKQVI